MFRTLSTFVTLAGVVLLGGTSIAAAQGNGSYSVKYEQVADDCEGDGLTLGAGAAVAVSGANDKLVVTIAGVTPMRGRRAADGQFKALSQGPGAKPDLRGKYSVSGKTVRDSIEMVFIAQFYRGKRPLCTQSWTVSGARKK